MLGSEGLCINNFLDREMQFWCKFESYEKSYGKKKKINITLGYTDQ